ncbi:NAD-P-binding protein [Trametes versicolor FP-101664 SS1]|uniref:NAD-P-binding protein n=1 Tax=Trametes versicolor (strain FP-101664) TaxID=717944 RepID=UPI000462445E|nr:NAD-P-binding protein [Trametes versicolor FP-101664 SS1]EIW57512.1 NAD-P-binding protein [Trametes versicolor FP-101664 SS1]
MKVLIIGATGFIGLPIAQAFVRAGHIVYGQTRSAAKAKRLAAEEIIPIVADVADTAAYLPIGATLDAIIDAVGGSDIKDTSDLLLRATAAAVHAHRPALAPKLTYIWTSGTWIHGDNRTEVVSDSTAPDTERAPALTSWRAAQEQRVIASTDVNGLVIRPSLLYGRSGSLFARFFERAAREGVVAWPGTPGGRLATIHTDDLAKLYVLATEKAAVSKGQIFDGTNDVTESTDLFLQRLVEVSGAKAPYQYFEPTNLFDRALTTTTIIRPYLGRALLGWRPRKAGLIDHLEIYYKAWQATQEDLS